ncbi:MAG TPA: hypothetical protein VGC41_03535, partial [Kofleriaceae bacterium]
MRWATLCLVLAFACNDVRAFEGAWSGKRVGEQPVLKVGMASDATAQLAIDSIDTHGLRAHLTIAGLVDADLVSIAGAEADALSDLTFSGSPQRVYLAFAATTDGGGEALAVIALYDENRIEVRVLRGGTQP